LIEKLKQFGITGSLLLCFKSFLSNRSQIVKYGNYESNPLNVTSGVPQPDHLFTLLFNIFTNNLPNVINSSIILLFADDAKLIKRISNIDDCIALQEDN